MSDLSIFLIIILAIMTAIGILTALIAWKNKKERKMKEPDYRAFFIIGISFLPMGFVFTVTVSVGFIGIAVIGIVYVIIGLTNKDKWKE